MIASLPSVQTIEKLHRKYAPAESVFDLVWTHCRIISDVALQLARNSHTDVDLNLVRVGCLLHDIGVYSLYDSDGLQSQTEAYVTHGIRGEEILQKEAYPELLYRFASHHTGAGLTKKQIVRDNLPLPHKDFLAETTEEQLVMYADKFHSKTQPPSFNTYEYYATFVKKFGTESEQSFMDLTVKFGVPTLEPLIARYGHAIRGE